MATEVKGLTQSEVVSSLERYGSNSLHKEKQKSILVRFLENLFDPIIRILIIALVMQIIFSFGNPDYPEIVGILVAILISTIVSTVSEVGSEKAFEKLSNDSNDVKIKVLRDGRVSEIPISDIVVGDYVYLSAGEKVPADGNLVSGRISVDQSALNGESAECIKLVGDESEWNILSSYKVFRGSVITEGSGLMKVGRVGVSTFYGMVAKDIQTETRESPLKIRLSKLASQISKIGYIVAGIVGVTFLINSIIIDNNFERTNIIASILDFKSLAPILIRALTLMITVIVVAAPEGLPMMITVVLSANMKKMLKENILVKKLVGIETAGSMNILFTDKTGTLTWGKPKCHKFCTAEGCFTSHNKLKKMSTIYDCLSISAKYNTDIVNENGVMVGGNPTDNAVYEYFADADCDDYTVIKKESFSSQKKKSSVLLSNNIRYVKGAPELILPYCKYMMLGNGECVLFNESSVSDEYYFAVRRGERAICVAIGDKDSSDLTFVALILMKDKLRPGVRQAVNQVSGAGIQVVMITGDGKETASAIAEDCGILNVAAGHIVLTSTELHQMTDEEVKNVLPKLRVVSRALPQDKSRLVRLSQELNLVTGMTGDGINDAPSLKLADVGFAMGSGTEVSKCAADVVILDNSLCAISKTILYGRTIFKSIRKFIAFQLIMNLVACGVSFLGQFIGVDTPITIIQMLWINIIMDTLGGLAFAGEPALEYYMNEAPKKRDEPILSREMLNHIFITGAFSLMLCIIFLTSPVMRVMYGSMTPSPKFYTAFYALFIFLGLFNCLLSRCERLWIFSNIHKNKPFIFIMLFIAVVQICMIYFGGDVFRCVSLRFQELSFVIVFASYVIPFEMLRRFAYKLK